MRTKLIYLRCSAQDKLSCIKTLKQAGLTISEALQLYVAHVAYIEDLPFQLEQGSDGKITRKKTSAITFLVNPTHYEKFQTACSRMGLTKTQALHLFIQYCVQHRDIPALFRPDCKEINKAVIIPERRQS